MAEIDGERFAPDAKVADLEHGQIAGQRQHNRLAIVFGQRLLAAVLVRDANAIGRWFLAVAHPEFRVCAAARGSGRGSKQQMSILAAAANGFGSRSLETRTRNTHRALRRRS